MRDLLEFLATITIGVTGVLLLFGVIHFLAWEAPDGWYWRAWILDVIVSSIAIGLYLHMRGKKFGSNSN